MTSEIPILHAINLGCIRQSRVLFTQITFALSPGEILLVEGPNGCGKSSLLRLIAGLATPACGKIFWEGAPSLQPQLHYLGHRDGIKTELTVCENLALSCYMSLRTINFDSLLSRFQLNEYKDIQTKYLSAGQRRRLALAKLLLAPKPLWILDEPMTALDGDSQMLFLSCLISHVENGGMAVISSHHALAVKGVPIQTLRWMS